MERQESIYTEDQGINACQMSSSQSAYNIKLENETQMSNYDSETSIKVKSGGFSRAQPTPNLNDIEKKQQLQRQELSQAQNSGWSIREGYVQRRTSSILSRWQICYCVLSKAKLYFFQNDMKINLLACINFTNLTAEVQRDTLTLAITLLQYHETIAFKTYTLGQAESWQYDISRIIYCHTSNLKIKFMQAKKNIYFQKDALSEEQFMASAQTGDIILMSTTDTQCAIQRLVTNSEYDHVAMVVRFKGEVKIFESNADDGVNIYTWTQFQSQFHQYEKMAIRKLHYYRLGEVQSLLMRFVKSVIGSKYELSATKLMRRESEDSDSAGRGYFCSQLVAKAYKVIGLLGGEKSSGNYWPVDFTMRGGVNLLDSAALGSQKLIVLGKHLLFQS